jgi:hypothetical protein
VERDCEMMQKREIFAGGVRRFFSRAIFALFTRH